MATQSSFTTRVLLQRSPLDNATVERPEGFPTAWLHVAVSSGRRRESGQVLGTLLEVDPAKLMMMCPNAAGNTSLLGVSLGAGAVNGPEQIYRRGAGARNAIS